MASYNTEAADVPNAMADDPTDIDDLPDEPSSLAREHPDVWDAYSDLGAACAEAGPIDGETKRLVKLALAIGAESEGAVHSHVRRGLEEGVDPDALEHVATLAIPTLGFPTAMAARSWIDDETE